MNNTPRVLDNSQDMETRSSQKRSRVDTGSNEPKGNNKKPKLDPVVIASPILLGATDRTNTRSEPLKESQNMVPGYPNESRMSQSAALHLRRQDSRRKPHRRDIDAGALYRADSSHEDDESTDVYEPRTVLSSLPSQKRADASTSKKINDRSSKKRTRVDDGLDSDAEENLQDPNSGSQKLTRQSKRVKATPKYNDDDSDEGGRRIRKTSKLNAKIAAGKGPQRGSLAPNGEVRINEDGKMEFRDANNPEWTLAAYHNDYRRQFLDEAAQDGQFGEKIMAPFHNTKIIISDHTPTRGEATDDETSFEPEQQSWGPERADWQNIVNSEGVKVMFEIDKPKSLRPPQEPRNWVHDGLVLLDNKNHPVKDWPGLNRTLSSEIESWRWEALTRVYPWLSVSDLLARMPHTRKFKGKSLPLQTPQAFTNRSYRFRVPNQIPASKMKNGSATYKEQILKNLEEKKAATTETLSALKPDEVDKVRRINKGKFKHNSRYETKSDVESRQTPPPSRKRKTRLDEGTESEAEHEKPKTKKPKAKKTRLPAPHKTLGAEVAVEDEIAPGYNYNYTSGNAYFNDRECYTAPTGTLSVWQGQEQQASLADHAGVVRQIEGSLVPLFATAGDHYLARLMDDTFTSPSAVIWARRNGHQLTGLISVHWYRQSTPRYVGEDGIMVEDVADEAFYLDFEVREPVPDDSQPTFHVDQPSSGVVPESYVQTPHDILVTPVANLYATSHRAYPDTVGQAAYYPPASPATGPYAPGDGVYPGILTQTPLMPYDSLVTPAMSLDAPNYGVDQGTLATPATGPYVFTHGIYPDVMRQPPSNPPVTPYAPAHGFYPDILGQTPSHPSMTPVRNQNAPLPSQTQIGRYQTESVTSEEVWRNHHGSTGF